jgi:cell division protein ZapA
MAEVTISINGRSYDIACDHGQEGRIADLAAYVDGKLQQIARAGGAWNEAHLLVLTSLVLADEVFEEREAAATRPALRQAPPVVQQAQQPPANREEEQLLVRALGDLAKRIETIAQRVQTAA